MRKPNAVFILVLLIAAIAGCDYPTVPQQTDNPVSGATSGTLYLTLGNSVAARTLLPVISMDVASWEIIGSISGTEVFNVTPTYTGTSQTVLIPDLPFGDYSITVNALNSSTDLIGTGSTTATITTGQTTSKTVTVTPIAGNGTLHVSVSWEESLINIPQISGSVTPDSGSATTLTFTLSGTGTGTITATATAVTLTNGYYTLAVSLSDNGVYKESVTEVARIVTGQSTDAEYVFDGIVGGTGSLSLDVTTTMHDPVEASITPATATMLSTDSLVLTAAGTAGITSPTYRWYLNGQSVGTSSTYTLTGLSAGTYRVDLIIFSGDGLRGGSVSRTITVS